MNKLRLFAIRRAKGAKEFCHFERMAKQALPEIFVIQWRLNDDLQDFSSFFVEMTCRLAH